MRTRCVVSASYRLLEVGPSPSDLIKLSLLQLIIERKRQQSQLLGTKRKKINGIDKIKEFGYAMHWLCNACDVT